MTLEGIACLVAGFTARSVALAITSCDHTATRSRLTSKSQLTSGSAGDYTDGSAHQQAFVVGETNGTWGTAEEVPGIAALDKGGFSRIDSLSCGSVAHCSAGGTYRDSSGNSHAFVVSEA
jgi:hypothetical protein